MDTHHKPTMQTASFSLRVLATLIDYFVFSLVLSPVFMLLFGEKTFTEAELQQILQTQGILGLFTPAELIISQTIVLLITCFFWLRFAGTPGKRLLKIRVVDATTGKKISTMQAVLRYVGYFFSAFFLGLGFFWMLFDKKQQTWHDKLANTLVIVDRPVMTNRRESATSITKDDDTTFTA